MDAGINLMRADGVREGREAQAAPQGVLQRVGPVEAPDAAGDEAQPEGEIQPGRAVCHAAYNQVSTRWLRASTLAIYDQGHATWVQLQRAGAPNGTTFWDFVNGPAGFNINATVPLNDIAGRPAHPDTDPASGVWGQVRDQTAAVVKAGGTYNQGIHGRPTPLAYGAYVADTFLPNVIPFIPGTNALWDPWQGSHNGKGLTEDARAAFTAA